MPKSKVRKKVIEQRAAQQVEEVVENEIIVGIITNKDLVKAFSYEVNPVETRSTYSIETSGFGI